MNIISSAMIDQLSQASQNQGLNGIAGPASKPHESLFSDTSLKADHKTVVQLERREMDVLKNLLQQRLLIQTQNAPSPNLGDSMNFFKNNFFQKIDMNPAQNGQNADSQQSKSSDEQNSQQNKEMKELHQETVFESIKGIKNTELQGQVASQNGYELTGSYSQHQNVTISPENVSGFQMGQPLNTSQTISTNTLPGPMQKIADSISAYRQTYKDKMKSINDIIDKSSADGLGAVEILQIQAQIGEVNTYSVIIANSMSSLVATLKQFLSAQ